MTNKLMSLEKQIQRLKEKRNKLYTQQAVLFYKEVEKIFGKAVSLELILEMLDYLWSFSSEVQKNEQEKNQK